MVKEHDHGVTGGKGDSRRLLSLNLSFPLLWWVGEKGKCPPSIS